MFFYIVCPTVLSCSNLQLQQKLEVKNIFKQEKIILQLTFNPGLTLTGFRTTRPRCCNGWTVIINAGMKSEFLCQENNFILRSNVTVGITGLREKSGLVHVSRKPWKLFAPRKLLQNLKAFDHRAILFTCS